MKRQKILIIEDEEDILALIHYNLVKDGYNATPVTSGEEGVRCASQNPPDLIILDLMLPGIDGLEVCRQLKNNSSTAHVPVIMLTAKEEEADVVSGLESGADDYITKPFSFKILLARIKTVLRRRKSSDIEENEPIRIGELSIHPGRSEVHIGENPIELTYTEFNVLLLLSKRPGWVFSRSQIMNAVHGDDYAVTERAVDVQIVGLRKKLGDFGRMIETVRGVGYRFTENTTIK